MKIFKKLNLSEKDNKKQETSDQDNPVSKDNPSKEQKAPHPHDTDGCCGGCGSN